MARKQKRPSRFSRTAERPLSQFPLNVRLHADQDAALIRLREQNISIPDFVRAAVDQALGNPPAQTQTRSMN